jgi:tRNA (cytidine32/uridine32-2'-O)-methyltransferase
MIFWIQLSYIPN